MDGTLSFLERRPNTLDSICEPNLEYLLAFTKSARTIWKLCGLNRDHLGRIAMRLGAAIPDSMGLEAEQLVQPVLESAADHAFDIIQQLCDEGGGVGFHGARDMSLNS